MSLCIIRFEENTNERTILPGRYNDRQQAELALEKELASYPKSGRDDEQDRWWAHDAKGKKFRFWIEPVGAV